MVRPLERFLELEAGSAAWLLASAAIALAWVNVHPTSYDDLWSTRFLVDVGPLTIDEDLQHIVNDLLMAIFFYVVALEIKRELLFGSLQDRTSALVPMAAALGTIAGGATAYVAVNLIADGNLSGWAIPAATDIAFALGALGLSGRKVPRAGRAFLLTLAVVDDIVTIAIIGVFFTAGLSLPWLGAAIATAASIALLNRVAVRSLVAYVVLAAVLWYAVLKSGVHATIAGVVLGFLTPAAPFHRPTEAVNALRRELADLDTDDRENRELRLDTVSVVASQAVSPLARMEARLHPWTAYVILPLFALANAGVPISLDALEGAFTEPVGLGIALGLVVGAPLGGIVFAFAVVSVPHARLPANLDWSAVLAITPLKGIGFTVAIFIAGLALEDAAELEEAKLAILAGSLVSGAIGFLALFLRHYLATNRGRATL